MTKTPTADSSEILRKARLDGLSERHLDVDTETLIKIAKKAPYPLDLEAANQLAPKTGLPVWALIDAAEVLHGAPPSLPTGMDLGAAVEMEHLGIRNYDSPQGENIRLFEPVLAETSNEDGSTTTQFCDQIMLIIRRGANEGDYDVVFPPGFGTIQAPDLVDTVVHLAALHMASYITGVSQPITEAAAQRIGVKPFFLDTFSGEFDCLVKVAGAEFGVSIGEDGIPEVTPVGGSEVHPGVISSATSRAYRVRNRLIYRPGTDHLYAHLRNQDPTIFTDAQLGLTGDVEEFLAEKISALVGLLTKYENGAWQVHDPKLKNPRTFRVTDGRLDRVTPRGAEASRVTAVVDSVLGEHLEMLGLRGEYLATRGTSTDFS